MVQTAAATTWLPLVEQHVHELLMPHKDLLEAVVAHPAEGILSIYALEDTQEYDHELGMALARFEVQLAKALQQQFEGVQVHPVPVRGITPEERSALLQGATRLL